MTTKTRGATRGGGSGGAVGDARLRKLDASKLTGEALTRILWPTDADIDGLVQSVLAGLGDVHSTHSGSSAACTGATIVADRRLSRGCEASTESSTSERQECFGWHEPVSKRTGLQQIASRAYLSMCPRFPEDHVIIDFAANLEFISRCRLLGASVTDFELNKALLNARKAGLHTGVERTAVNGFSSVTRDAVVFASELAARAVQWRCERLYRLTPSIDRILCDGSLRSQFDAIARDIYPGHELYAYRFAALAFRKAGRQRSMVDYRLLLPDRPLQAPLRTVQPDDVTDGPGMYFVLFQGRPVFTSWARNLRERMCSHLKFGGETILPPRSADIAAGKLEVRVFASPACWRFSDAESLAVRYRAVGDPSLNFRVG